MRLRSTLLALSSFLLAPILILSAAADACAEKSAWEVVKYKGEDYVTTRSLQKFYQFQSYSDKGGNIFYRAPDLVMKARSGSRTTSSYRDLWASNQVRSLFSASSDRNLKS